MEYELLRHPTPFESEGILNYLYRLAEENCCTIGQLKRIFKISNTLTNKRFNKDISDRSIGLIAKVTRKEKEVIYKMTLQRFNYWFIENEIQYSFSYFRNTILSKHLKYCPYCLKENNYNRIHWNLELVKICLKHMVFLIQSCNNCGKEITKDEILDGKCKCGLKLTDVKSQLCDNNFIIEGQKKIYNAYGICTTNIENNDIFYHKLNNKKYIEYVNFLIEWIIPNIELFEPLGLFKNIGDNMQVKQLICVEWVSVNWPQSIYYILNKLNNAEFLDSYHNETKNKYHVMDSGLKKFKYYYESYIIKRNSKLFSSIEKFDIEYKFRILISNTQFMKESLSEYFINNFTIEYFENKLQNWLFLNKFIEVNKVINIFLKYNQRLSYRDCSTYYGLINIFHTYKFDNKNYFLLSEIVDFFKLIVKKENLLNEKNDIDRYKDIDYFLIKFSAFDIRAEDLIKLIKKKKVNVKFDPVYRYGMNIIYLNKTETTRELLLLLLNNLEN